MSEPPAVLHSWDEVPQEALTALIARRIITGERMMISQLELEAGAVVPTHAHENEQITHVLAGRMRFWLGSDESQVVEIGAGEVLVIPPHLPHRVLVLERTLDVDIFCPPRQDWLDGTDSYLRDQ
jgi:quercetin dioxygenase-like cupin family protein